MLLSEIQENLILNNVGPIKNVNLTFKKVNIIIGKNQTGKSIAAKLLQVCREGKDFNQDLKDYKLDNYNITEDNIKFSSNLLNGIKKPTIDDILEKFDIDTKNENVKKLLEILFDEDFGRKIIIKQDKLKNLKDDSLVKAIKSIYTNMNKSYLSTYIPAERAMIPFLSSYGINFYKKDIPLPKYILDFAANFRLAKDEIKEIDVLGSKYKYENDEDRIYFEDKNFIDLKEASSGVQSTLPLKLTVKYLNQSIAKQFIVEEPELNLFPIEQFELVKYLVENSMSLVLITHSPYILNSLNILLYAHKVGNQNKIAKKLVEEIIPSKYWINSEQFSGYIFEDGTAEQILENDLIGDNILDDVSDEFADIFDKLNDIYFKVKNA